MVEYRWKQKSLKISINKNILYYAYLASDIELYQIYLEYQIKKNYTSNNWLKKGEYTVFTTVLLPLVVTIENNGILSAPKLINPLSKIYDFKLFALVPKEMIHSNTHIS